MCLRFLEETSEQDKYLRNEKKIKGIELLGKGSPAQVACLLTCQKIFSRWIFIHFAEGG